MRYPLSIAARAALVLAGCLVLAQTAFALDASLPYRNFPGFVCHQWNSRGECSDFSYYDNGTAPAPIYQAPALPAYPTYPTYPTYTNNRCGNPTMDCTGSVSVRVTATPGQVAIGDFVTYSIYVRNDDSQTRTVNVDAYKDAHTSFDSATFGGFSDGTNVHWTNLSFAPNSSRTLTLRVRVENTTLTLTQVTLRVVAGSGGDTVTTSVYGSGYSTAPYNGYNGYAYRPYTPYFGQNSYDTFNNGFSPRYYRHNYSSSSSSNRYYGNNNYWNGYYNGNVSNNGYYYGGTYNNGGYYYDGNGSLHYQVNGTTGMQGNFYCDSSRFVCNY